MQQQNQEENPVRDEAADNRDQQRRNNRFAIQAFILTAAMSAYILFYMARSMEGVDLGGFSVFNTIFVSILMQAFPFMLIGVLVSSALHIFVSDSFIVRIFPRRHGLGFVTALFAGIFFPVCECAIVPVAVRLVKKGVAPPIAITFMLSAPIINPIVIVSTLYAFPGQPGIALLRVCFGLTIALCVGLVLLLFPGRQGVLRDHPHDGRLSAGCGGDDHDGEEHCHHEDHDGHCCCGHEEEEAPRGLATKIRALFVHAGEEFFSVGKYLVIGAFLTSLFQTLVPRGVFTGLLASNSMGLLIMMAAAFLFSACSTSDAFIARGFLNRFSLGSVMGFLVFGPMMDIKNTLMLLANFKKGFVIKLTALIVLFNLMAFLFY